MFWKCKIENSKCDTSPPPPPGVTYYWNDSQKCEVIFDPVTVQLNIQILQTHYELEMTESIKLVIKFHNNFHNRSLYKLKLNQSIRARRYELLKT